MSEYFSDTWTPKHEYGNLLFDEWDKNEWIKFDYFMLECLQLFLNEGLIEAKSLRKKTNKLIQLTSPEFYDFTSNGLLETGIWIDKKDFLEIFKERHPHLEGITSNKLSRWVRTYADENGLELKSNKTADKYGFKLSEKVSGNAKIENQDENNI